MTFVLQSYLRDLPDPLLTKDLAKGKILKGCTFRSMWLYNLEAVVFSLQCLYTNFFVKII